MTAIIQVAAPPSLLRPGAKHPFWGALSSIVSGMLSLPCMRKYLPPARPGRTVITMKSPCYCVVIQRRAVVRSGLVLVLRSARGGSGAESESGLTRAVLVFPQVAGKHAVIRAGDAQPRVLRRC